MVNVVDDDTAGLRLSSDVVRLDENGTKTYTVRLETKPTAEVTVTLASTPLQSRCDGDAQNGLTFTSPIPARTTTGTSRKE